MTANVGYATLSIIPSAKGMASALTGSEFSAPLDKLGADSASSFSGGFTKGLAAVGIGAAAVAAIGVGVGAALYSVGSAFDEQFDKIRVGTGETGTALEGLQDSFKNVLKSVPTDFDSAGTAISDLNTRLGLTGAPLEALAGQFLNLSRITDTDLGQNIDSITRLFGDWGIATEDQAGTIDELFRATQASGIGIDQLSGSVVQFGAPLRNLGFTFEDSIALLSQFEKSGVNTETVFAGLKAGVGKLAKAGESVPDTFRRVVDQITALGPGTEATALAIELFGQRAGPDLADAIAGGKFEIDDMLASITDGSDTVNAAAADTADFSEKWQLFKNKVLVGLQPLAEKVFNAVGNAMDTLGPKVEPVIAWFSEKLPVAVVAVQKVFDRVWPRIQDAIAVVIDWLVDDAWPRVQQVFDGIVTGVTKVVEFFKNNKDALIGLLIGITAGLTAWAVAAGAAAVATLAAAAPFIAVGAAVAAIGVAFGWAYQNVGWFRAAVDAVVSWFRDTVLPALQTFVSVAKDVISSLVDWVRDHWDQIRSIVMEVFDAVATYVETIWNTIYGFVEGYITAVKGIIQTVTSLIRGDWEGVWNGIQTFFSGVWESIKSVLSGALSLIVQWFREIPGRLLTALGDLLPLLWQKGLDLLQGMINGLISFHENTLAPWIRDLPDTLKSAMGGLLLLLFDKGVDLLQGMLNGVKNVWTNVIWPYLTGIPGKLLDAIGDLSTVLYDIGKSIIGGLWDGMKKGWEAPANWLGSLGGKIVGLKGPPSYDKVLLVGNGELVMGGFLTGMQNGWDDVDRFLGSRADTLGYSAGGIYQPPGQDGTVGGSVTGLHVDHMDVHDGTDVNTIARIINYELAGAV